MNLSMIFPPEIVQWLIRYGTFVVVLFFGALLFAVLMRPFWLWYSGRSESLDRLKRLDETSRKSLLELEILNQTLSIPLKKSGQKGQSDPPVEPPLIVTQEAKDSFLKVLEKSRTSRAQDQAKQDDSKPYS